MHDARCIVLLGEASEELVVICLVFYGKRIGINHLAPNQTNNNELSVWYAIFRESCGNPRKCRILTPTYVLVQKCTIFSRAQSMARARDPGHPRRVAGAVACEQTSARVKGLVWHK